ncbi:MAG TPA: hypothetical protein VE195_02540 [Acidobacteriaceae bacterium]|nr:hypothetical protein [Acidobacteriaceae bacterium]
MQLRLRRIAMLAVLSALSTMTLAQTPASCTFTFFDFGGPGGPEPSGINRWGNVVGNSGVGPFIRYSDGRIQSLSFGFVGKRNRNGTTVGEFSTTDNHTHGFIENGNQRVTIDFPGATHTGLRGINAYGSVVGNASAPGSFAVAIEIKNGKTIVLPFGMNTSAAPQAISDAGLIVGIHEVPDPGVPNAVVDHGFVFANGQFMDFAFPGALGTTANDVNAQGQIVGDFGGGTAGVGNYIYSGGKFFTVKLPGNNGGTLTGINGFGTITGAIYQNSAPTSRGFVGNCTLP